MKSIYLLFLFALSLAASPIHPRSNNNENNNNDTNEVANHDNNPSQAQDGHGQGRIPSNDVKRRLELDTEGLHRVSIKSFSKNINDTASMLIFSVSTLGLPRFTINYKKSNETTQVNEQYRMGLFRLVEYNDTISVADSNHYCSFRGLNASAWSNMTISEIASNTNDTSTVTKKISTFYAPNAGNCSGMTFTFDSFVASSPVVVNSTQLLTPNSIKYSLDIQNFPYKLQNSKLALVTGLYSFSRTKTLDDAGKSVQLGNAAFKWDPTVLADGHNATVTHTTLSDSIFVADGQNVAGDNSDDSRSNVQVIIHTFDAVQPKNLYWDPQIAVATTTLDTSATSARPSPTWSVVIFMAAAVLVQLLF